MSDLPAGLHRFLDTTPFAAARVAPIEGDASFRRYFRLASGADSAILMHAPPPHEDPAPFVAAARWLRDNGLRAPAILAADETAGWVLIEDFGEHRMKEWIDAHPGDEYAVYAEAVDVLVRLHAVPPGPFSPYDMAVYRREADLFVEWYCPAAGLTVDRAGWDAAWDAVLAPLAERQASGVTVLRDYHAENIMLLEPGNAGGSQGLLDFQDALVGHPAYDLVSLLQDARRDVDPALEQAMIDRYVAASGADAAFLADYAVLGAQRNAKIVGIFTRLWRRDGKPRYPTLIPRVWSLMERDLAHPALAPVAEWFAANIPARRRADHGGPVT